ncbi:MAG: hemerythrin domain-containing protein [Gammaproteobacteria bacterium]|nr:hemerythrin domain-containing protein [Gammaproteobacteria bacterium]
MSSDTRQLLSELREDHRNMAIVLDVLANTVSAARDGDDPDFELVDEIMRYMTIYPDAVHHPKEDVVYAELKAQRPDLAAGLDDVPQDHRDIAVLGGRLRDDVEAIVAGAAVRREHFVADCENYVQRLRNHMQWEESDLFKRVDEMLDDKETKVDIEQYLHIKDPVFELEVEAAFRRLLSSLPGD